jgi:hypothetical protein
MEPPFAASTVPFGRDALAVGTPAGWQDGALIYVSVAEVA